MAEYIDRAAAMTIPVLPKEHKEHHTFNLDDAYEQGWGDALENLKHIPVADVAPVRHARWIKNSFLSDDITTAGECSECGEIIGWFSNLPNYCPDCGAMMDGGGMVMTDNYQTAIGRIMDCILRDVVLWEREHCETPGRIFVSPRLEKMLKADFRGILPSHYGNTESELFGIPISVYSPEDQTELGYYLSARGRRFASIEEDLQ